MQEFDFLVLFLVAVLLQWIKISNFTWKPFRWDRQITIPSYQRVGKIPFFHTFSNQISKIPLFNLNFLCADLGFRENTTLFWEQKWERQIFRESLPLTKQQDSMHSVFLKHYWRPCSCGEIQGCRSRAFNLYQCNNPYKMCPYPSHCRICRERE